MTCYKDESVSCFTTLVPSCATPLNKKAKCLEMLLLNNGSTVPRRLKPFVDATVKVIGRIEVSEGFVTLNFVLQSMRHMETHRDIHFLVCCY